MSTRTAIILLAVAAAAVVLFYALPLSSVAAANGAGVQAIVPPPVVRIDQNEIALGGPTAGIGTTRITLGKFSLGRFL